MACVRYLVTGRVQGVFYRASTRETADELGLTGWVRNCADGSVELVACGDESTLKQLEEWLWEGPRFADVEHIDSEILTGSQDTYSGFTVRY